jgi:hypothetical protein
MSRSCNTHGRRKFKIFIEESEGKNSLEDLGVDGRIKLKRLFTNYDGRV